MINEIQENPGEQNSNQVGSKTSSVKDYIEVVPSVPLYRMQGHAILKITKLIFDPEEIHPKKMVLESSVGSCILIDNDYNDLDEFSTFPNRPDTIAWYPAEEFLYHCDIDIDHAVEEFRDWGITQVDLGHGLDITVDVRTFLEAIKDPDGGYHIVCHYDAWRKSLRDKGFFSMLSSQDFGAKKTSDLYNLRMASETQYRILKSQEGFDTTRVHTDAAMMSKYAICFAASILRHSIMKACLDNGLDTNDMIQKMDRISLLLLDNQNYRFIRDMSLNARKLFGAFSMNMDTFDEIARDYTSRKTQPINSQVHKLPEARTPEKRKRGRKPGSKNKATAVESVPHQEQDRPKRGRPKGSKNKPKQETIATADS